MNDPVYEITREALKAYRDNYTVWLSAHLASETEKEYAKLKIMLIDNAIEAIDKEKAGK